MRVTETRMIDMVTGGVSRAREQAADAGQKLQTGLKVARPSDDASAWAEGQRAAARQVVSQNRGSSIARARDRLNEVDGALGGVGSVLAQVTELAVQFGNDTYNATDRAEGAKVVLALRDAALASANASTGDGEYVLAGTKGGAPPFDAGRLVTLANWQEAPFNRWAFQHVAELIPTALIPRGEGPIWELVLDERDLT